MGHFSAGFLGPVDACLVPDAGEMRQGKILALRWKYIDLDRGVVQAVESLEQTRAGGIR